MRIPLYLVNLPTSRRILWSYVIWWAVMVVSYFRPDPRLWATSLGIGLIVGCALMLCTGPITLDRFRNRFWESLRLYICPFMVSSFSALIADQNFVLIFSSEWQNNSTAIAAVVAFLLLPKIIKLSIL